MEKYRQEREKQEKLSRVSGGILTVAVHVVLVACFFVTGFTYLDPPPPERTPIVIDFSEPELEKPRQTWNGSRPQVEQPDPSKPINLVQQSEAPLEGSKANEAPESTVDDFGDVETPEPERKKEINRKAESTIFKGDDLCITSILKEKGIDFGEYALGRRLKRELIQLEFSQPSV